MGHTKTGNILPPPTSPDTVTSRISVLSVTWLISPASSWRHSGGAAVSFVIFSLSYLFYFLRWLHAHKSSACDQTVCGLCGVSGAGSATGRLAIATVLDLGLLTICVGVLPWEYLSFKKYKIQNVHVKRWHCYKAGVDNSCNKTFRKRQHNKSSPLNQ